MQVIVMYLLTNHTKLNGIETGATADQTNAEIKLHTKLKLILTV